MSEEVKKEGEEQRKEVEAPQASSKPEAHVSKYKKKLVADLVKKMKENPIVGAINMENMPASSLGKMRSKLRGRAEMFMTKRRVMKYAFDELKSEKKGIEKLIPYLKGMPALLFTKENPFKLFKIIKQNKTPAAAKPGQIAPKDIEIKAGPTPFAPGPIISELGALGLKSKVEEGKIMIIEDSIIVKEGEEIKNNVASLLQRLGIEPMEIGLDITAIYEDGVIYGKDVLDIDEEEFLASLNNAARWAFNLAVEAGHFTKETVGALIPKAFKSASAVALEGNFMTDDNKEEILAKAERQANALKEEANIEVGAAAKPKDDDKEDKSPQSSSEAETKKEEKKKDTKDKPVPAEEAPKGEVKEEKESVPPVSEEKKGEGGEKEAPVEEKKEEPKAEVKEEKPQEEAKPAPVEEKKEEEAKPEEPKVEEAPKEEEKPEEPAPEPVEEKKEEPKVEEPAPVEEEKKEADEEKKPETKEEVKEAEEEIKEELESIKGEVEEQKEEPKVKELDTIKEEVETVEEKLEDVDKAKQELPSTEKVIIDAIEKNKEAGKEEIKTEKIIVGNKEIERKIDPEKQKKAQESEALYEQLKKEGTLRNVEKEVPKPREPMSPQDIIAEAHKKMDENKGVPSAHDLMKKKLQRKK